MANQQKIGQRTVIAVRELAQRSLDFWRDQYSTTVIDDQPETVRGHLSRRYGTLKVLITGEGPSAITFRIDAPYAGYLRGKNPTKILYRGEQEIARYDGKLNPVTVFADLDDNEANAVELFANGVRQH